VRLARLAQNAVLDFEISTAVLTILDQLTRTATQQLRSRTTEDASRFRAWSRGEWVNRANA
jgi:hypothetical protein